MLLAKDRILGETVSYFQISTFLRLLQYDVLFGPKQCVISIGLVVKSEQFL